MEVLFLIFLRNFLLFSIVATPIYISVSSAPGFPLLTSLPTFAVTSCFFYNCHSNRCEVISHYDYSNISPFTVLGSCLSCFVLFFPGLQSLLASISEKIALWTRTARPASQGIKTHWVKMHWSNGVSQAVFLINTNRCIAKIEQQTQKSWKG